MQCAASRGSGTYAPGAAHRAADFSAQLAAAGTAQGPARRSTIDVGAAGSGR